MRMIGALVASWRGHEEYICARTHRLAGLFDPNPSKRL